MKVKSDFGVKGGYFSKGVALIISLQLGNMSEQNKKPGAVKTDSRGGSRGPGTVLVCVVGSCHQTRPGCGCGVSSPHRDKEA